MSIDFDEFYTREKEKSIPDSILNETEENRKWFLIGFSSADGNRKSKQKAISFSQKHKITISGFYFSMSIIKVGNMNCYERS